MSVRILIGDMRERMRELPDNSVDSVVCDPPYHLTSGNLHYDWNRENRTRREGRKPSKGFMGQTWDGGDVAFDPETWAEVLRVLKPGGHLVAFSGCRTYHRMVCAIEDAGFDIREMCAWVFGSGFPKSHNLNGEWEGWGSALKPAFEPICLARKPLSEKSIAANVLKWGTGALNIDGCRIEADVSEMEGRSGKPTENKIYGEGINRNQEGIWEPNKQGRWPANLCHDGSDEVVAGFPADSGANGGSGSFAQHAWMGGDTPQDIERSKGSAARFFYCAKTSSEERGAFNNHPTVKPVALMQWLVRLVTPRGGTVLDPFMGSGSTGLACDAEQVNFIGCEMSPEYAAIAEARIRAAAGMFADIQTHSQPATQAA